MAIRFLPRLLSRVILVLAISTLIIPVTEANSQTFEVEVIGSALNLRTGPHGSAQIVTKVPRGTRLTVIDESGDWYRVSNAGGPAWVSKRYVRTASAVVRPTASRKQSRNSGLAAAIAICLGGGPLLVSLVVWRTKHSPTIMQIDRWDRWIAANHGKADRETSRGLRKYWARPVFGVANALSRWTGQIEEPSLRASVRFTAYSYATTATIIGTLLIAYVAVIVVLVIVAILVTLWILSLSSDSDTSESEEPKRQPRSKLQAPLPQAVRDGGKSRETSGAFRGEFTEHLATDGTVLGRSFQREGVSSDYIEHEDADGSVAGRSYRRNTVTGGEYFEHVDRHGNALGTSREVEGFFGDHVEHRDQHGNVLGESRESEGPFSGSYSEHTRRKN